MKLSNHTTSVLKNFATINQNLVIKEGNEMSTMSAMKNIIARATVEETFPKEIAIYDLNEFLGALSLFSEPILDFSDSYVMITEENKPSTKMKYFYSDPSVVTSPSKMITMPSNEVRFTMSNEDLSKLKRAASAIGAPDMVLEKNGSGSSLIAFGKLLLFSADGADNPCLYALNKEDGSITWRTGRTSKAKKNFSFCTPLVIPAGNSFQIISPASDWCFSYDLNGREIWKSNYRGGYSVVPRPIYYKGLVFVSSGYDHPTLYAIEADGIGDVTKRKVRWSTGKAVPRNSSPVIVNGLLFMVSDAGVVSCLDALTGEIKWMERVAGSTSASLIHAAGMIDTAGASFIILGMILQSGFSLITAKLIFIGIFIFFTSPITGHVTANLARKKGVNPIGKTKGKTL